MCIVFGVFEFFLMLLLLCSVALNAVREDSRIKLISLGESVSFAENDIIGVGDQIVSSAFLPPELFSSHSSTSSAATLLAKMPSFHPSTTSASAIVRPTTSSVLYPNAAKHGDHIATTAITSGTQGADDSHSAGVGAATVHLSRKSLCTKTGLSFQEKELILASAKHDNKVKTPRSNYYEDNASNYSKRNDTDASACMYDLHDRVPMGEFSVATRAIDMWSLGATLYSLCAGETLFLASSVNDAIDNLQLTMLADWTDGLKTQRLSRVKDCFARNLLSQLLYKDPHRRPKSIDTVLKHPFLTQIPPSRFEGMAAEFDVCLVYRSIQRNPSPRKHVVIADDEDEDNHSDYTHDTSNNSSNSGNNNPQNHYESHDPILSDRLELGEHIHACWLARLLRARGLRVAICDTSIHDNTEDGRQKYFSNCAKLIKSKCVVVLLSRFSFNIHENTLEQLCTVHKNKDDGDEIRSNDGSEDQATNSARNVFDPFLMYLRLILELPAFGIMENGIVCVRVGDRSDTNTYLASKEVNDVNGASSGRHASSKNHVAEDTAQVDMSRAVPNMSSVVNTLNNNNSNNNLMSINKNLVGAATTHGIQKNELNDGIFLDYEIRDSDGVRIHNSHNSLLDRFAHQEQGLEQDQLLFANVDDVTYGHYFQSYRGEQVGRFGGCHPAYLSSDSSNPTIDSTVCLPAVDAKVIEVLDREGFGTPQDNSLSISETVKRIAASNPFDIVGDAMTAWTDAANFIAATVLNPPTVLPVPVRLISKYSSQEDAQPPMTEEELSAEAAEMEIAYINNNNNMTDVSPVATARSGPHSRSQSRSPSLSRAHSPSAVSRPFTANGVRPLSPLSPELMHSLGFVDSETMNQGVDDGRQSPTQMVINQKRAAGGGLATANTFNKGLRIVNASASRPATSHLGRSHRDNNEQEQHFTAVAFSDNNAAMASTIALLEEKISVRDAENQLLMEELNRVRELMKIRTLELNLLRAQSNMKPCDTL
jgi:hypothetical protein